MTSYRLFGVVSRLRYAKIKAPAFNLQGRALLPSVDGQVLTCRSLETTPNKEFYGYFNIFSRITLTSVAVGSIAKIIPSLSTRNVPPPLFPTPYFVHIFPLSFNSIRFNHGYLSL